jgi:hypothetical protein
MTDQDLLELYNYDAFVPEKFTPWMNFDKSPAVGSQAPDFPLWNMEREETTLSQIWSQNLYTVVEFGSFT